jgi:hypothetical protein
MKIEDAPVRSVKTGKIVPPSKEALTRRLVHLMSDKQWEIISLLTGKPRLKTNNTKVNFLKRLFVKSRSHSSAKGIGRELQKWAAAQIGEFTGLPHGKDEAIESRAGGASGPDVRLSLKTRLLFPFTLECKSGVTWSLPSAIKQCQANLYPETFWMVVLDRPHPQADKRIPPVVCLDGQVFFKILRRAGELGGIYHDEE